jgi:hypothetical protein
MLLTSLVVALLSQAAAMPDARESEEHAVALARTTLSERLSIPEDQIQLGHASPKQWPDTSLGCPEPGMMYAQVVTPGYWIQLQVGEKVYDLRVGNGQATVCEPKLESGRRESYVSAMARLYKTARHELAMRLQVDENEVKVTSVRAQTWPDAGLGCPGAGPPPSPGKTRGFRIDLSHDGTTYEYHSDMETVVLCSPTGDEPPKR